MNEVFTLQHSYKNNGNEETKFIGIYTTEQEAKNAIERLKSQSGFKDRPNDFYIDKYQLNKDNWSEGYVTV